jgi:hypothetical protein
VGRAQAQQQRRQVAPPHAVRQQAADRASAAKLIIAGLDDPSGAAAAADTIVAGSPQPVREEIVTTDAHGTDLLTSQQGERVQGFLEQFFAQWLRTAPSPG